VRSALIDSCQQCLLRHLQGLSGLVYIHTCKNACCAAAMSFW
jgi:hypothetical protein